MRKVKELEQRVKALEDIVQRIVQEHEQEKQRLNPLVMGGRRSE